MTEQMKQKHVDAWQGLFEPEPHCKPNKVKFRHKIFLNLSIQLHYI